MHVYALPLSLSLLLSPQEERRLCVSAWKIKPPGQRGPPWDAPKQPHVEGVMTGKRVRRARVFFFTPPRSHSYRSSRGDAWFAPSSMRRWRVHSTSSYPACNVRNCRVATSAVRAHDARVMFVMNNTVARELP